MFILGINGGFRQGYQDISACLIKDGRIVAAVEEERLSRVKHSPGQLPYLSILEVLKIGGVTIFDIEEIAFHGSTWGDDIGPKLNSYFMDYFGHAPSVKRYHHHDCHAAGTFFSSGFGEALVLTIDNSGDGVSCQVALAKNNNFTLLKRYERPSSFGVFYSLITQYCGFQKDRDEFKLMGLAGYGNNDAIDFSWLIDFSDGELFVNTAYINTVPKLAPSLHKDEMNFNEQFIEKMGKRRRLPFEPVSQYYKDVAASAQKQLENVVLKMLAYYVQKTGIKTICMSGGVALNCLMNQKIMNAGFVDAIFIQPASTDAGISMGAGWLSTLNKNVVPIAPTSAYLGREFGHDEIKLILDVCGVKYVEREDFVDLAAHYLAENKVIGWFQGPMEFGPRALGNRSILANPGSPSIKQVVNQKIKFRESFRPFGASVLEEDASRYFEGKNPIAPHMTITYTTKSEYISHLEGVTHVDGTCRIQTVNALQNPLFYKLLQKMKSNSEHGICLNTSFNLSHEPIVYSPQHALATFYGSGIDALFLGNFVITK